MSNFETGCPTSRHTVWYFSQDHCQDARNKIACKPSHLLSRTSAEPGRLTLRQAVQIWDILSDVETYFTQDHCQEALTRLHASSHVLSGQSVSQNVWLWDRLSNFETYCLILHTRLHTVTWRNCNSVFVIARSWGSQIESACCLRAYSRGSPYLTQSAEASTFVFEFEFWRGLSSTERGWVLEFPSIHGSVWRLPWVQMCKQWCNEAPTPAQLLWILINTRWNFHHYMSMSCVYCAKVKIPSTHDGMSIITCLHHGQFECLTKTFECLTKALSYVETMKGKLK